MTVSGDVSFDRFTAAGALLLSNTAITSQLSYSGAQLTVADTDSNSPRTVMQSQTRATSQRAGAGRQRPTDRLPIIHPAAVIAAKTRWATSTSQP